MPVEQTTTANVACDNPDCPNKDNLPDGLTSDELTGWLIVTVEQYAVGSIKNGIFCSWECVVAGGKPEMPQTIPVVPTPPPEPTP